MGERDDLYAVGRPGISGSALPSVHTLQPLIAGEAPAAVNVGGREP